MRTIGIDENDGLFYEGDNEYGRGIWPSPTVMIARVVSGPEHPSADPEMEQLGLAPLVFREDTFDPVARLRRGRFYFRMPNSSRPCQWHVRPHPALPNELGGSPRVDKSLYSFYAWLATQHLSVSIAPSIVALGTNVANTLWRVLSIEKIVTGEDLVTLKARASMGMLPELNERAVPAGDLPKVRRVLDALVDAVHILAPGSIVDRARDASQWCLGVWLSNFTGNEKHKIQDLAALAKNLPEERRILRALAQINARLHSRVKPNEQERYPIHPITEADAEYALAAVGLLLREIGWGV